MNNLFMQQLMQQHQRRQGQLPPRIPVGPTWSDTPGMGTAGEHPAVGKLRRSVEPSNTQKNDLDVLKLLMLAHPNDHDMLRKAWEQLQRYRYQQEINDRQFGLGYQQQQRNALEVDDTMQGGGVLDRLEGLPWGRGM